MDYCAATVAGPRSTRAPAAALPSCRRQPPRPVFQHQQPSREHGVVPSPGFRRIADEVQEPEARRMREALEQSRGNQRQAAELIGMPLRTFVTKLKQYGLRDK